MITFVFLGPRLPLALNDPRAICSTQLSAWYHCWLPHGTHTTWGPTVLTGVLFTLSPIELRGWSHLGIPCASGSLLSSLVGPHAQEDRSLFPMRVSPEEWASLSLLAFESPLGSSVSPSAWWVVRFHSTDCSPNGRRQCRNPNLSSHSDTHSCLAGAPARGIELRTRGPHQGVEEVGHVRTPLYKTWLLTHDRDQHNNL